VASVNFWACQAGWIDTPDIDPVAEARLALGLLDLTDLSDDGTPADIDDLCAKAIESKVAAVCIWPRFVPQAVRLLVDSSVRIATVVNFPAGGTDIAATVDETVAALADGADEIDVVLPYRALVDGDVALAGRLVTAVSELIERPRRLLKVILETGELPDQATVALAARTAIESGADFIKTSTGKTPVSATPEAARTMLDVIRSTSHRVGLKPSGGIRDLAAASTYLQLAREAMGPAWISPATFRFGASGLRDALIAVIEGRAAPGSSTSY
jgi:deoxyribose-phosphate aldolase